MSAYLICVALSSVFLSLSELILPRGKTKNCVKIVLSVCFALILIKPFAIKTAIGDSGSIAANDTLEISVDVSDEIDKILAKSYENDIKTELLRNDLVCESVNVEICRGEIKKIRIYLSNFVIIDEQAGINNIVVRNYVAEKLKFSPDKIEIYV